MKSLETEVAVLKEQTTTLHGDLTEMKDDIKEIKVLLSEKFVTNETFMSYKKQNNMQKWLIGIITAVFTTIVTYEITDIFRR